MRCCYRVLLILFPLLLSAAARSQSPDLSGFWSLRFDSGNIPASSLLPGVTGAALAAHAKADAATIRWCRRQGMPAVMTASTPLDILQSDHIIALRAEIPSASRQFYLAGSGVERPNPEAFEANTNGFSVGRWEAGDLLVETSGFSADGVTAIPGGGFRTPTAHLLERFHLEEDGQHLLITSTWTDPKVFAKPHVYAMRYFRMPRAYNAAENFCDSNDSARAKFLTEPLSSVAQPVRSKR